MPVTGLGEVVGLAEGEIWVLWWRGRCGDEGYNGVGMRFLGSLRGLKGAALEDGGGAGGEEGAFEGYVEGVEVGHDGGGCPVCAGDQREDDVGGEG